MKDSKLPDLTRRKVGKRWSVFSSLVCLLFFNTNVRSAPAETFEPTGQGQAARLDPVTFSELARPQAAQPPTAGRGRLKRVRPLRTHYSPPVPKEVSSRRARPTGRTESPNAISLSGAAYQPDASQLSSQTSGQPSPAASASFLALLDNATTFNPDTQGAVGPNHLMVTLSSEIRIQNRAGGTVSTVALNSFWSSLGALEVYDPRVLYDPFGQRWIHVAVANFTVNPGLLVAVSRTSDPTGLWNRYFIDIDTAKAVFTESPNVGFNKNWIVVQANMFNDSDFFFSTSDIFTFSKADLYANGAGAFKRFSFTIDQFGGAINAQVPAATYDNTLDTLYLVGHWSNNNGNNFGFLRTYTLTGSVSNPTFTADQYVSTLDPIPWESFAPNDDNILPQAGTTNLIYAGDSRLQNVVYRNGSLWTAHTVFLPSGTKTRTAAQWWEILPATGTAFQFGRVEDTTGSASYAYPSIGVNERNDVLLGYSRFSTTTYPSAAYAFKTDQDTPGNLRDNAVLKAGESSFYVPDGTVNHWGNWSATMVDPLNNVDLWTLQEYAASRTNNLDRWGTWWGRVSPPVDLRVTLSDAPDPILAGQTITYSMTVTNQDFGKLASGVILRDTLPAGTVYLSSTASQGSCSQAGGVVTCDLGTLGENSRATATITVRALTSDQVVNSVTASANGPDLNAADNSASTTTTVNPAADLAVGLAASANPVNQGEDLTYSILVTNLGPVTATTVKLTNTLPASVTYVSSSSSQGSCSRSGAVVTCNLGTMPVSGMATVTILVRPSAGGTLSNEAKVGSAVVDPAAANNFRTLTVRANALPLLQTLSNLSINEDTSTGPLAFTVSDAETPASILTVTASSSDPTLVPNANVVLGGSGGNRTLTLTPLANQFGTTIITRSVTDSDGATVTSTFVLTVNSVNDPPVISSIANRAIDEDGTTGLIAFTIGDVEKTADSLSVSRASSNTSLVPTANVVLGGTSSKRTVTVTPAPNKFGTATITVSVSDGTATTSTSFILTVNSVNDPPTISDVGDRSINEDGNTGSVGFSVADVEDPNGSLVLSGSSSNTQLVPNANIVFGGSGGSRNVKVTPAPDQFGTALITLRVTDSDGGSATDAFLLTVNPVNDPPTLGPLNDVTINEDSGPSTIVIPGISAGPDNEMQVLTVTASSGTTSVLPDPSVAYTSPENQAILTVNPATNANGTVTVTVTVTDDQSSNNKTTGTFKVIVLPVNDPPYVTDIPDQTIDEDTETARLPFSITDEESTSGSLDLSAMSSNPTLVPPDNIVFRGTGANRNVTVTPAPDQFGTALISVIVSDGADSTVRTFQVTVNSVNDPPSLSAIADQTTSEDTATGMIPFTVNDVETPLNSLVVRATSSDPALVPNSAITLGGNGANRTLTILPAANQAGLATIFLSVTDGDSAGVTNTFVLTVNPVNDPPTLDAIANVTRDEDSGPIMVSLSGITSGVPNENQTLAVTATSSRPGLIPDPIVSYASPNHSGTLTLQPVTNANGNATITVTVNDGGVENNLLSRTFDVVINSVNDLPVISTIGTQSTDEDVATPAIAFTIDDVETSPANLTLSASSSNEELVSPDGIVFGGTGSSRTVTITPLPDQFGSAFIFIFVNDANGGSANTGFELSVKAVNDAPTLTGPANQTVDEDTATPVLPVTVSDLETPARDLVLTAASSNPTLVPNANVTLGGTGPSRTVTVRPVTNLFGTTTITLAVTDGDKTNSQAFLLTVNAVNDRPTLAAVPDQMVFRTSGPKSISLTGIGTGAANETQTLTLTAVSDIPGLVPDPTVTYSSPNNTGSLTIQPSATATGSAHVAVTLRDDGGTDHGGQDTVTRTFTVTVEDIPTLRISIDQDQAVLSWTSNVSGFVPQSRDQFGTGAWTAVTEVAVQNGSEWTVTVPRPVLARFYRLKAP
jgi:uncharacterized repeat protein (TIGR01451 family)